VSTDRIDRDLIIQKATELFRKKGYYQTSMDDIARACKLQKSSLYHHIPSRKALVIMVIEYTVTYFKQNHFQPVYDNNVSPSQRLANLANTTLEFYSPNKPGCLITNLAVEIAETVPEIKDLIAKYFAEWMKAITFVLKQHHAEEQAKQLAEDVVAQIQGAIFLEKITQGSDVLRRATQRLVSLCSPNVLS
jgi:AcrR family transcriptional regulator